jgi:GTP cyclohydrolase II
MDNTCECREQLHETMQNIIDNEEGMIVHIPHQDGRGKGIPFKLATLFLQKELGLNTVESAAYLANKDKIDVRTYAGVVGVLKFFNIDPEITKINLATNNPDKLKVFEENGYTIDNTPLQIKPNDNTRHHLDAKKKYLEHNLGIGDFGRGE